MHQDSSAPSLQCISPPILVPSDEGVVLREFGDWIVVKISGEQTNGSQVVLQGNDPPGGGPPPHIHHREDETSLLLSGSFRSSAAVNLADGQWHMVNASWLSDTGGMSMYVDGALASSYTGGPTGTRFSSASSCLTFGINLTILNPFQGELDEISVYSAPISAQEVATHDALGSAAAAAPEPGSIALVLVAGVPVIGIVRRRRGHKPRV